MDSYYLPLLFEEFILWFRLGHFKAHRNRFAVVQQSLSALPLDEQTAGDLIRALPTHESLYSLIIVSLNSSNTEADGVVTIDFTDIRAAYTLNENARQFLQDKLKDTFTLSTESLVKPDIIRQFERERELSLARRGGEALIYMLDGRVEVAQRLEQKYWPQVEQALQARHDSEPGLQARREFLSNLFCYSRSGSRQPIPKKDIGFFIDVARTLRDSLGSEDITALRKFGDFIKKRQSSAAKLSAVYHAFEAVEELRDMLDDSERVLASVIYLKLTTIIRDTNDLTYDDFHALLDGFNDTHGPAIACGVWWTGVFWGFTQFAPLYYQHSRNQHAPLLNLPSQQAQEPVAVTAQDTAETTTATADAEPAVSAADPPSLPEDNPNEPESFGHNTITERQEAAATTEPAPAPAPAPAPVSAAEVYVGTPADAVSTTELTATDQVASSDAATPASGTETALAEIYVEPAVPVSDAEPVAVQAPPAS